MQICFWMHVYLPNKRAYVHVYHYQKVVFKHVKKWIKFNKMGFALQAIAKVKWLRTLVS